MFLLLKELVDEDGDKHGGLHEVQAADVEVDEVAEGVAHETARNPVEVIQQAHPEHLCRRGPWPPRKPD